MFNIYSLLIVFVLFFQNFNIFSEKNINKEGNKESIKEENKEDINKKKFEIIDNLYSKKNYDQVIEFCISLLKTRKLNYLDEINILINLGDAYFDNNEKKRAIETYKLLLNKYKVFEDKDYVLYKLCCCAYKRMPKCPYVDLDLCNDVIYYGNYSKKHIKNEEYLNEINKMIFEAIAIIEESKVDEINFFYENKLYNSAVSYIDDFIDNCNNKEYFNYINLIKAKCLFEQIKLEIEKIKIFRKNKLKSNNDLERKYFENTLKYLNDIRNISSSNLKDETNIQIDDILLKSEDMFLTVF